MPTTFTCRDCGYTVHAFALAAPPEHGLCLTCSFIADIPDAEEREELRTRLIGERYAA